MSRCTKHFEKYEKMKKNRLLHQNGVKSCRMNFCMKHGCKHCELDRVKKIQFKRSNIESGIVKNVQKRKNAKIT